MKSTKNLTIILTICLAIIIAIVIIVAYFKQQDVKYINSHIGSFEAETIQSHDKLKLQSGTYTINDYKPNGKELDISKKESNEVYAIDLSDKHVQYTKDKHLNKDEVKIDTPSKHANFSLIKSFKDDAKVTIITKNKLKEKGEH